jgi:hypothetical protein
MLMNVSKFIGAAIISVILQQAASAVFVPTAYFLDPVLPGTSQYDQWNALTSAAYPGYPGFPGSGSWPSPMGSNAPDSEDAVLTKVSGGAYPAGGSIYFGGFSSTPNTNGARLAVVDNTPVANLANVILQVDIGEAYTYDFWNDALPTLSYNGGAQNLAAGNTVLLNQYDNGTVTMPDGVQIVYINSYLLQWDLSSVGPISSFSVAFNGVQHAQLYALQLNQSDEYASVPEPATAAFVGIGLVVSGFALRRRSRA